MHAEIRAAIERHQGSPALIDEVLEIVRRAELTASTRLTAFAEAYDPIDLEPTWYPDDALPAEPSPQERYEDLGMIGRGGMGEVRRVRDLELNRVVAMKIIHPEMLGRPRNLARFVEEAQATAQLQHPHILPVHDAGIRSDGRAWFTMREVRGRTLGQVLAELHEGTGDWTFRRVMGAFLAVCHAVAYAHDRGVIHRDLKPDNVVLGQHGEVYLLDWGLAKVLGRRDWAAELGDLPTGERTAEQLRAALDSRGSLVVTDRAATGSHATRAGTVTGTPVYMAPEQARGEVDRIDARSDVYGLGAMLYELLSGKVPYRGDDVVQVVSRVSMGAREPLEAGSLPIPTELAIATERAMAPDPQDRFQSAGELAQAVEDWLDGARRREQALSIVDRALTGATEAGGLRERAGELRAEGQEQLAAIEPWRPEEDKREAWEQLDEAEELEAQAALAELGVDQGLQAALRLDPELPEAHAALAERYRGRHRRAELERDRASAARLEALIQTHAEALPTSHGTRVACTTWLRGDGALTLITDPPGAEVLLHRYESRGRRLVEVFDRSLGHTPLREVSLPMGSYLLEICHPDRDRVRYPVAIPRLGLWDGVAPGERDPTPIWLPPAGHLGPGEIYLPAGWFRAGGDREAVASGAGRRVWCDGRVIRRFAVTNREYLAFLDHLVASGQPEQALSFAPAERAGGEGEDGRLIYGFDGTHFSLRPDVDGDVWHPDWPVVMVDWHGARAWLAWHGAQTGRPWRLPTELEWEKAARGVDGRSWPWGDHFDPSWACMVDSHRGRRLPGVEADWPVDLSPCGMRSAAGNVGDWCLDPFQSEPAVERDRVVVPAADFEPDEHTLITAKGGSWLLAARHTRCANRLRYEPWTRNPGLGFRGIYPI